MNGTIALNLGWIGLCIVNYYIYEWKKVFLAVTKITVKDDDESVRIGIDHSEIAQSLITVCR